MMRVRVLSVTLVAAILAASFTNARSQSASSVRPVHTYSIVAQDSVTGDLGVAVQSHWFSVGSMVTWAEAGWARSQRNRLSIRRTDLSG